MPNLQLDEGVGVAVSFYCETVTPIVRQHILNAPWRLKEIDRGRLVRQREGRVSVERRAVGFNDGETWVHIENQDSRWVPVEVQFGIGRFNIIDGQRLHAYPSLNWKARIRRAMLSDLTGTGTFALLCQEVLPPMTDIIPFCQTAWTMLVGDALMRRLLELSRGQRSLLD